MDELKLLYKFIIIDKNTNDVVVKKTLRDVSEFINLVCENNISHNNVRLKLIDHNFFEFECLIVHKLSFI
jgi:hypothetical protein